MVKAPTVIQRNHPTSLNLRILTPFGPYEPATAWTTILETGLISLDACQSDLRLVALAWASGRAPMEAMLPRKVSGFRSFGTAPEELADAAQPMPAAGDEAAEKDDVEPAPVDAPGEQDEVRKRPSNQGVAENDQHE